MEGERGQGRGRGGAWDLRKVRKEVRTRVMTLQWIPSPGRCLREWAETQSGPRVSGMLVKGAAMGRDSRGYDHPVRSPSQHHPVPPSDNTPLGFSDTIFSWLLSSLAVGSFSVLSILTLCLFSTCWCNPGLGPAPHSPLCSLTRWSHLVP